MTMLIALEGIDGSGKTSVAAALADRYPSAEHTAEPTDSWYGDAVRRSIRTGDAHPLAELFLFMADHAVHLDEVIRPALEAGRPVVTDRYTDSRCAYQAATLAGIVDRPLEYVASIHRPWSRPPDLTVYLEVDPETGAERSDGRNKFEAAEFLTVVAANYDRLIEAEPDRFVRIDARRPIEAVTRAVVDAVDPLLAGADAGG